MSQVEEATPEEVVAQEFDRLRGRLCGIVESWGVPERQERGMIQTLKSLSYDTQKIVNDFIKD